MVEDLGLEQSLYIFTDELQKNYPAVNILFHYKFTEGILPKAYALAIYRISKELVTNAAKHSGSMQIDLLLVGLEENARESLLFRWHIMRTLSAEIHLILSWLMSCQTIHKNVSP